VNEREKFTRERERKGLKLERHAASALQQHKQCCCCRCRCRCARESLAFPAALALESSKPCPISQDQRRHSFPPSLAGPGLSCLLLGRSDRLPLTLLGARVEFCLRPLSSLSSSSSFLDAVVRSSNQPTYPTYICLLPVATLVSVCERLRSPFHQSRSCAYAAAAAAT
jgi:hypothetical protein